MVYATTGYTIATNGQTLVIAAPTVGGATAKAYTTAACTVEHTFPQTITSDTTYYVHPDAPGRYLVSAKQPDGTELWGGKIDCFRGDGVVTISPLPTPAQVAAGLTFDPIVSQSYGSARETMPRWAASSVAAIGMTSQTMRLAYLTAPASEAIHSLAVATGTTAAAATPSLVRLGLYTVASDGALALAASTTNDTTLLAATSTLYTKALSADYAVTAGARYAIGLLVVTATTAPIMVGQALSNGLSKQSPRLCASYASQADLPASATDANVDAAGSGSCIWAAMIPA